VKSSGGLDRRPHPYHGGLTRAAMCSEKRAPSRAFRCKSAGFSACRSLLRGGAGSQLFDRQFRPTDARSRARFESVYVAMRTGEQLPSIDVFQWQGNYFVSDGLHRAAVARALGHDYLPAQVTEIVA
jgi:hypothetical protein